MIARNLLGATRGAWAPSPPTRCGYKFDQTRYRVARLNTQTAMTDSVFRDFSDSEFDGLARLKTYVSTWCREHQTALGVGEMALGAALLTAGWQNGALQMGVDFVVHKLNQGWAAELTGAGAGGLAALAANIVGNIGVVGMGGYMAIPALALAGGAALVFGLAGYTGARLVQDFLHQAPDMTQLLSAASMVAVGSWLLVDGARRIPLVRQAVAFARDKGLELARVTREVVVESASAFARMVDDEVAPVLKRLTDSGAGAAIAGAAGLGAVGAVVAPSLVTVAGSSTLGSVALSLGLVSAPVWPIAAGVGVGLAAGYGLWSLFKRDDKLAD